MKPRDFSGGRRHLAFILVAGAIAIIVLYSMYAALPFLMGPSLTITAETMPNGLTTISGATARVSYLAINDTEVALSEDGAFSATRAYPSGYTWLKAEAKDRFGRTITKTLTFVVNDPHAQSQN